MPKPQTALAWLIWTVAAGLAVVAVSGYTAPFSSNQNTYFLHGLAAAGYGELARDWMTAHADTFPLFTHLITAMYWFGRPVGDALAFVFYVLSCGVYVLAIYLICRRFYPKLASPSVLLPFLAVLAFFHSSALSTATDGLTAVPALGVALFYPLGGIFQPQAFAVLLLAGLAAFVWNRPLWGAALIAAGCVMHPAFLACGGLLVLGMLIALWRQEGRFVPVLMTGGPALLIVLPMVVYIAMTYAAADPEVTREAHRLMAVFRSPHHTLPSRWLWDPATGLAADVLVKLSLCAAAIVLLRRTPLAWALGTSVVGMAAVTFAYAVTGNHSIGVAYPWRGFALVVPLSTALVTAWTLSRYGRLLGISGPENEGTSFPAFGHRLRRPKFMPVLLAGRDGAPFPAPTRQDEAATQADGGKKIAGLAVAPRPGVLSVMIVIGLCALGAYASILNHARRFETTKALHAFVREDVGSSHLYLIPSTDLTMMSFRLETGAPLFVDLKSHPVTADGFLEWHRRLKLAAAAYNPGHKINCAWLGRLLAAEARITHVVSSDKRPPCSGLGRVYQDNHYSVWKRKS